MAKEKTHLVVLRETETGYMQLHSNDDLVRSTKRGWIKAVEFKTDERLKDNLGKIHTIDSIEHTNGIFHC